jgi:hypothetical protein
MNSKDILIREVILNHHLKFAGTKKSILRSGVSLYRIILISGLTVLGFTGATACIFRFGDSSYITIPIIVAASDLSSIGVMRIRKIRYLTLSVGLGNQVWEQLISITFYSRPRLLQRNERCPRRPRAGSLYRVMTVIVQAEIARLGINFIAKPFPRPLHS